MAKKYYWLKLKDDFFDKKEIKRLRRMAGGDTYTIIYLKMLLLSLKEDGNLYFDDIGDNFVDEISLEIDEDMDNVKMTLSYLQSKGLLEIVSDNEYHLSHLLEMVGSETDKAEIMRRKRAGEKGSKWLNGNTVTETLPKRYTEKEKEKELEEEKNIVGQPDIAYKKIIDHLNLKTDKSYKSTTRKTQDLIKARINDEFTEDDCIKVIDIKVDEWKGTDMDKYLRPETLFGNKFEGYLNQETNDVADDGYDYGF